MRRRPEDAAKKRALRDVPWRFVTTQTRPDATPPPRVAPPASTSRRGRAMLGAVGRAPGIPPVLSLAPDPDDPDDPDDHDEYIPPEDLAELEALVSSAVAALDAADASPAPRGSRLFAGGSSLAPDAILREAGPGVADVLVVRAAREKPDAPPPPDEVRLTPRQRAMLRRAIRRRRSGAGDFAEVVDAATRAERQRRVEEAERELQRAKNRARLSAAAGSSTRSLGAADFQKSDERRRWKLVRDAVQFTAELRALMEARRAAEKDARDDAGSDDGDDFARGAGAAAAADDSSSSPRVESPELASLDGGGGAESAGSGAGPDAGPDAGSDAGALASAASPSFLWQPMTRVSIATDLPLELFEDDDDAYDWHVIAAEEAMRDERVRVDATGAEKAMHGSSTRDTNEKNKDAKAKNKDARGVDPTAPAPGTVRATVRRRASVDGEFDSFSDAASDATSMDDETARRIAGERRAAAERLARMYDANVADARRRRDFVAAAAPRRPPMRCGAATSASTSSSFGGGETPRADPKARERAAHYGRWYVPSALRDGRRFDAEAAAWREREGGERAKRARELKEREARLAAEIAPLYSTRLYASYLEETLGKGERAPGYMRGVRGEDGGKRAPGSRRERSTRTRP